MGLRALSTSIVLVSVALMTACVSRAPEAVNSAPDISARAVTGGQSDAKAIAKARADSVRYPYTAADIRFMSSMVAHHEQAVTMSALAPARASSGSVRILAQRIASSQNDEIASVKQWLRDRRQPTTHDMTNHASGHEMVMPGMLTAAQIDQLERAKGPEFDRLFLTFMILHHRGAVTMVKELFATDGAAQDERVFKFASDVNVDQITEIARMEKMLEGAQP